MPITFEILTPRGVVLQSEARHVRIPGVAGEFGVLPGHTPFMTTIRPGVIELDLVSGGEERIATSGGFVEVLPDKVVVLAETAETSATIDLARAEAARKRAEEKLRIAGDPEELELFRAALDRAKARIRAKTGN